MVIGGVAPGASAESKAKRVDPDAEVRIIQERMWFHMVPVVFRM